MADIRSYRDLRVYQAAMDAAMRIFELSKRFPAEERYSLTDQVRRCSRSVCSNIGEAWRKRRYPAHFVSKLSDSETEAEETRVWVEIALRCTYLTSEESTELDETYDRILAQLVKMISGHENWIVRSSQDTLNKTSSCLRVSPSPCLVNLPAARDRPSSPSSSAARFRGDALPLAAVPPFLASRAPA